MGMRADMDDTDLQQALEHDAALKAAAAKTGMAAEIENADGSVISVPIDAATMCAHLDARQATLAKGVALSFTDVARTCAGLALTALNPGVDLAASDAHRHVPKAPDFAEVANLMKIANEALKLSRECTLIGDQAALFPKDPSDVQ